MQNGLTISGFSERKILFSLPLSFKKKIVCVCQLSVFLRQKFPFLLRPQQSRLNDNLALY